MSRLGDPPPAGALFGLIQVWSGNGGHDWLRWNQEQGDCIFHVEWRFSPIPDGKRYNSGVFVRNSADAAVWFGLGRTYHALGIHPLAALLFLISLLIQEFRLYRQGRRVPVRTLPNSPVFQSHS